MTDVPLLIITASLVVLPVWFLSMAVAVTVS